MEEKEKISRIWPKWSVESVLGQGSFGTVYKVRREEHGYSSCAAVKVIRIPHDASEIRELTLEGMDGVSLRSYYKNMAEELLNEIRVMESLKTAGNIVSIEDCQMIRQEEGPGWELYIRMELLESLPLYLEGGEMEPGEIAKLGIDICEALKACEKKRVIHRDIKPDNIFVNEYGGFKLGDFGIAKRLESTKAVLSQKGTAMYMAPEIYRGESGGGTVDLYALGITLYKLLNRGRFPFMAPWPQPVTPEGRETALRRRMSGETVPPPEGTDPALGAIVAKACAARPEMRYQKAEELQNALIQWREERRYTKTLGGFEARETPAQDGFSGGPHTAGQTGTQETARETRRAQESAGTENAGRLGDTKSGENRAAAQPSADDRTVGAFFETGNGRREAPHGEVRAAEGKSESFSENGPQGETVRAIGAHSRKKKGKGLWIAAAGVCLFFVFFGAGFFLLSGNKEETDGEAREAEALREQEETDGDRTNADETDRDRTDAEETDGDRTDADETGEADALKEETESETAEEKSAGADKTEEEEDADFRIIYDTELLLAGDQTQLRLQDGEMILMASPGELTWSSGDPSVASVSEEGIVTAQAAGNTEIRADYQGKEAVFELCVAEVDGAYGASIEAETDYVRMEVPDMGENPGTELRFTLNGNLPERFTAYAYFSPEIYLGIDADWQNYEGSVLTMEITPLRFPGKGTATVLLMPEDEPEHVVAAASVEIEIV